MFRRLLLCRWTLDRFFHALTYLLVAVAFSMLVFAEQLSPVVLSLFLLFFCGSLHSQVSKRCQLAVGQANFLTWLYLPVFLVDVFFLSRSFVPATLHLILFVQLVKIYQAKGNRDYFYLILLSFLQVLAASSLTINISFFAGFLLFVLVCLAALMAFEMKRTLEASVSRSKGFAIGTEESRGRQPAELEFSVEEQAWTVRAILSVSSVSLCVISLLGTALFFAFPRFGAGYFSRTMSKTLSLSGFSDRIRLGSIGTIQLDPSIVMRVKVNGDRRLFDGLKWRGVALDHFDGKNWSKRVKGSAYSFPSGQVFRIREPSSTGTLVKYQVMLEPCSTYYLFTLDRVLTLRGNLYPFIYDPFDDSITARPHPFYRLTYQAESVLSRTAEAAFDKTELPFEAKPAYLQLPGLDKHIFDLTRSITFGAQSLEEKADKIEKYLQTNYSYSLEPSQLEQPQPIATFLFESKKGHCEYFASAMVVMLRTLGIPSRIVNGFRANEYNDIGGDYIIRGKDAHSWVEAHSLKYGWQTYDPTPASSQTTPQHRLLTTINNYLDAFELFWGEWVLGYDEVTQISLFRDLHEKSTRWADQSQRQFYNRVVGIQEALLVGGRTVSEFARQAGWRFPCLFASIGVGVWLAFRLHYWLRRQLLVRKAICRGDGTLAIHLYSEMLTVFRSKGKAKPQNLTPNEFVETFGNQLIRREVEQLTGIYNEMRFSQSALSKNQVQQAYWILSGIKKLSKKGKVIF